MVEYALTLFIIALKRGKFEVLDEAKEECDGLNLFINDWSVRLMRTNSENTRLMTLKCLNYMLRMPLSSWSSKLMDIANAAFKLLEKNAASMGEVTFALINLTYFSSMIRICWHQSEWD